MFDEVWGIIKGVTVLAISWVIIFKISDSIQNLPWLVRRRLQRTFEQAQNSTPINVDVRTYSVVFNDGKSQATRFLPEEINDWVARCNADAAKNGESYRVIRVVDEAGKVVCGE